MTTARTKAYVAFTPPDHVRALIEDQWEARFRDSAPGAPFHLAQDVGDAAVVMVQITDKVSADAISALPATLKAIAAYSVGYDHIDLDAARSRGIAVFHTPDVLTTAVAENAFLLMLGAARRARESMDLIRSRAWQGWTPRQLLGFELQGKRLGLYGFGRIGREVARRAQAFGMKISYLHTRRQPDEGGAKFFNDRDAFLADLDVLLLAAPSTAQTRGFLDSAAIEQMHHGAIVVNIARGDLIKDDDLVAALQTARLRGAGLDVFNNEPQIDPRYYDLPNLFMLPHIGSSTEEARAAMAQSLIDGVEQMWRGQRAPNQLA